MRRSVERLVDGDKIGASENDPLAGVVGLELPLDLLVRGDLRIKGTHSFHRRPLASQAANSGRTSSRSLHRTGRTS